ncbi:MAG: PorV/PorQ family protein [Ignavibacteria bacterium]|nr:PorV/PorQ family protein [Ignavibacteria bacterium]
MFNRFGIIILMAISFASIQKAQTVVGKYAGEFMAIGVGGRALGMGGAYVAVGGDVTSGYWNPAGLARINYPQGVLMHQELYGSIVNYNYAAVAIPYNEDMTFAVSAVRLSIDGIPDTRNAGRDRETGQIIDYNDPAWRMIHPNWDLDVSKITEFNNTDWAFYLSFAKRHSENFYWGANVKIIRRDLAEFGATGIGFDIGAWYNPYENLFLGANIQDVTTTYVAWSTGRNELISPTAKIGAAYQTEFLGLNFLPALDFDIRFEGREYASSFNMGAVSFDVHTGIEIDYKNVVALRAGYNDIKQITLGAGIKLPKLNIDYSFARFNQSELERLDDSHKISLILTLEDLRFLRKGN